MTVTDDADVAEAVTEPCAACQVQIDPGAEVCPECGNHPAHKAKWASVGLMVAGLILTFVFPPVGILLFLVGLVARLGMVLTDYPAVEYDF